MVRGGQEIMVMTRGGGKSEITIKMCGPRIAVRGEGRVIVIRRERIDHGMLNFLLLFFNIKNI